MAKPEAKTVTVGSPFDLTNGYIWYALADDVDTLPTDASSDIDETIFTGLGHISEDGIELSEESDSTDVIAFGHTRVRTVKTSYAESIAFALMQAADIDVAKFVYGEDNVTEDDSGYPIISHTGDDMPTYVLAIDLLVAPTIKERVICPAAQISERDTITFNGEEASGRQVTCELSAGSDSKTTCYEYFATVSDDSTEDTDE